MTDARGQKLPTGEYFESSIKVMKERGFPWVLPFADRPEIVKGNEDVFNNPTMFAFDLSPLSKPNKYNDNDGDYDDADYDDADDSDSSSSTPQKPSTSRRSIDRLKARK